MKKKTIPLKPKTLERIINTYIGNFSQPSQPNIGNNDMTNTPIYRLLKAFRLQQYTKVIQAKPQEMIGFGYGESLEKIGRLNYNDMDLLINRLGAFPGHRAKLMSVFQAVKEVI